jgi:predicted acetyltransferase
MIQIIKTDLKEIESLRNKYLNSLPEFQELYLELMIENSSCYKLFVNENQAGYAIKTSENVLIEFYLENHFLPKSPEIFNQIISELSIEKVYCKSFDYILLTCCLVQSYSYQLIGTLFRDFFDTTINLSDDFKIKHANESDLPFLLKQQDGLFETPQELEHFVKNNNILLFEKNNNLAGCGFLIRVHKDWNYYDIGMWVNPDYRKRGVATQIIAYLKDTCINNKWKPICGCAIDNIASQKTLEKNGFISKHKLIEFNVKTI